MEVKRVLFCDRRVFRPPNYILHRISCGNIQRQAIIVLNWRFDFVPLPFVDFGMAVRKAEPTCSIMIACWKINDLGCAKSDLIEQLNDYTQLT